MPRRKKPPEITFQQRIAVCLIREHGYGVTSPPITSDVMAATDPRREQNFRWHNTGLTNTPQKVGEYPVKFLLPRGVVQGAGA